MPQKNSIKPYVKGGIYHIYNRGVEKRDIFIERFDYQVFIKYLRQGLSKPPPPSKLKIDFSLKGQTFKGMPRQTKNYYKKIDLLAYCLMPNHFHLLIQQSSKAIIKNFMQSLSTRYALYFNNKYDRVGGLFQGRYKAVLVTNEAYLVHLSRYIHLNPLEYTRDLIGAFTSYRDYLSESNRKWIKPEPVLSYYSSNKVALSDRIQSYKNFVERYKTDSKGLLGKLTLED